MPDKIVKLEIDLPRSVWYAGELLTGTVVLDAKESFKIRGVRVQLKGKGHARWQVRRGSERHTVKQDEAYLDAKKTVWGMDNCLEVGGNDALAILPHGKHRWQFRFQLPDTGLPPSFESRHCRVRYTLRCIVDVPFASNPSQLEFFTLVSPHSDCMQVEHMSPVRMETVSPRWLLLPCSQPLKLSCTLERSAYCCGEHIKLKCLVANATDQLVRISVKLIQNCCFFIGQQQQPDSLSKEFQNIAFEYRSQQIKPRSNVDWDLSRFLRLPPMPPTVPQHYCQLLAITYSLRVHLIRNGKSDSSVCLDFPFTISTLPFRIPQVAVPPLTFQTAIESVEGGMYISPVFTLGQVYDGSDQTDSGVLFQPLYPTVSKNPAKLQRQRVASIVSSLADCAEKVSSV